MIDIGGGFAIIERHEWGARDPRGRNWYLLSDHGGKTAHYSTGEELGVDDTAQWVRNIQSYHMDTNRWDDVGYHFLYDRDGNIYAGRPLLTVGAHAGHTDGNRTAGCCFLGDDDPGQDVPDVARRALAHLSVYIDRQTREGPWFGHRDWKNTPCPGDEIYAFLPELETYLEDDMALSDEDVERIAKAIWTFDLPHARTDDKLPAWRYIVRAIAAGTVDVQALAEALAEELPEGYDPDAVARRVAARFAALLSDG